MPNVANARAERRVVEMLAGRGPLTTASMCTLQDVELFTPEHQRLLRTLRGLQARGAIRQTGRGGAWSFSWAAPVKAARASRVAV